MTIETKHLTGGETAGSGIFDELMRTMRSHIEAEQTAGRITEKNYATVYLGSLDRALATASDFLLKKEEVNARVKLIAAQTLKVDKDTELVTAQKDKVDVDTAISQYQLANILPEQKTQAQQQTLLIAEQVLTQKQQTLLVTGQVAQVTAQTALTSKQESLVDKQILTESTKTTTPIAGSAKAMYDKTVAEKELLAQRKLTELAQTSGTSENTGGTLGAQMSLYENQAEGFIRDSEQKAAKIMSDAFAISYSTDTQYGPHLYNLDGVNASKVIEKLMSGIGITNT